MGGGFSKPVSSPMQEATLRSTNNSQNLTTDNNIRRLAIDPSAVIGSLYDAREDRLLKTSALNIPIISVTSVETAGHSIIDIGILEGRNLSDIIRIDQELCLSIYLNIIASKGISLLIKYPFAINKHTRFFSYYYPTKKTYLNDEKNVIKPKAVQKSLCTTTATHVVTAIQSGIHVVVVLQLSPKYERKLDSLLKKIKIQLTANIFQIEPDEERLFNQFTDTNVFSNISDIVKLTKLTHVCQKLIEIIPDVTQHRALEYTLQPIRWFFPSYPRELGNYYSLKHEHMNQLEVYLYQLLLARKSLKIPIDYERKKLIEKYLKQQFDEVEQQMVEIEELYQEIITRSSSLILKIRSSDIKLDAFNEPLTDSQHTLLLEKACDANNCLNALKEKAQLINDLERYQIEYWNVKQLVKNNDQDLETIVKQLVTKDNQKRIFCFDDKLENPRSSQWNKFYTKLIEEHKNNSQLEFVYADFSFCSCQLQKMEILSPKNITEQENGSQEEQSSTVTLSSSKVALSTSEPTLPTSKRIRLDEPNPPIFDFINVLLLGESGVGKSTFVNAIVNYLKFKSLREARSSQPIVLMPVSFLITVGNDFEERIIRFGGQDQNEDHNHPGQSVTQCCRSYVFTTDTQTKIRLIDTPGMGDTRGLDQDDLNMQHILSYINNLSHLNAICILLKPNESRLNVVFRSYFTRLISFLGENARNNIIFCFTNTRGTFFAPGNTGPLLKKMLNSHSIKDIPYQKANTFCFDNESFRYLVARLNEIEFDDYQKEEYKRSWMTSVAESNRLLRYICSELKPYPQKDWQSMEHAHFQIIQLIRPMLETVRNTMRNMILLDKSSPKSLIQLQSTSAPRNSSVCLDCKRFELLNKFWIVPDKPHLLSNRCPNCQCDFSRHLKVDYVLTYATWIVKQAPSFHEMEADLDRLKQMITEFVYFFKYIVRISKESDPILSAFNRIINEEKDICSQKGRNVLNSNLYDELVNLKEDYEKTWTNSASNQKPMTLSEIYKLIKKVSETNTIREQLDTLKQTQKIYITEQETLVS